jgi:hypothetical protein
MGLLPLRGPPKPQPYENTKRFVRRCRSLFSSGTSDLIRTTAHAREMVK